MMNLIEYTNIDRIKCVYKVSEVEIGLDTDIRGAIYNQMAMKRIR
jgi:hypothetical protein